jgi:hypothetical protein
VRVLHDEPKFSEAFMAFLLARKARVEEDLVDQLFNSSEKRLARVLLLMANFGKEGKPEPVITKISQETLAEIIGTTRPPALRIIKVPSPEAMSSACQGDPPSNSKSSIPKGAGHELVMFGRRVSCAIS